MTRYRDMTTPELVEWALGFDCPTPATGKLIYALAKRLEQTRAPAPPPEPATPPQPARERARTIEAVIRLGRLSREARAYLSSKGRPHWSAGVTSTTSSHTSHLNAHSPLVQRELERIARREAGRGVPPHWTDYHNRGITCTAGHLNAWPTATRGY